MVTDCVDVGSYLGTSTSTTVYILLLNLLVSVSVCTTIFLLSKVKKKLTDVYLYHGTTVYIVLNLVLLQCKFSTECACV